MKPRSFQLQIECSELASESDHGTSVRSCQFMSMGSDNGFYVGEDRTMFRIDAWQLHNLVGRLFT